MLGPEINPEWTRRDHACTTLLLALSNRESRSRSDASDEADSRLSLAKLTDRVAGGESQNSYDQRSS